GLGGRDLSEKVGGIMAIEAIKMLQNDEGTKILVLVSKPPSEKVAKRVISLIKEGEKPAVICFLGKKLDFKEANSKISVVSPSSQPRKGQSNLHFSSTLEEAAREALKFVKGNGKWQRIIINKGWRKQAERMIKSLSTNQRYLRGLYSGGTLCYEAQQVLTPILGKIFSNKPLIEEMKLADSNKSKRHTCLDLGDDEYTVGRLHPMIDSTLRSERLIKEALDKDVAVFLFDVVLGYAASPDPAGDLLPAIIEARNAARKKGRSIALVAHVCGTDRDPQVLGTQEEKLKRGGVLVLPNNASASRVAGWITTRGKKMQDT
ncbi:MAG: acyl-CoA synthetase FdrA, partial [Thermodesulfobacteriota bacterium]